MPSPKAWLAWSTGKDSAWALHVLRQACHVEVVGLMTTVTTEFSRVSMHAIREELLDLQAQSVGLPVMKVRIPWPCSNAVYEREMMQALAAARADGVEYMAFGDLFLADVRSYREKQLADTGIEPLFPLWQRDTTQLAREMVKAGLRATLTCVDPRRLSRSFAGRTFDSELLAQLPAGVDPCGEAGEFHTCVTAGPMLRSPLNATVGEVVEREGFVFADLVATVS